MKKRNLYLKNINLKTSCKTIRNLNVFGLEVPFQKSPTSELSKTFKTLEERKNKDLGRMKSKVIT